MYDRRVNMAPVILLFIFLEYLNMGDCKSRQTEDNYTYYSPFQPYAQPVHLPLLPQYEIDIPEQEGKLFGGVAATRYETIIIRETVRPVCLLVDGNVPSCDHIHNYNNHPKDGMAMNARRPTLVDYESYFIEPSKPDVKIEITEIPFKGAYMLTGTAVEPDDEHAAGGLEHATPPMSVRPVAEGVHETPGTGHGRRQLVQNALGAIGTAFAAGLGANAAGLVSNAGGLLVQPGNGVGGLAAAVGHGGGNRNQVTMQVTRVDKVLDDHVTVTLVPKNCMPAAGQAHALRPCAAGDYRPYAGDYQPYAAGYQPYAAGYQPYAAAGRPYQQPERTHDDAQGPEQQAPAVAAADIVSTVDGLVRELISFRETAPAGHGHRYGATSGLAGRPFGAGPFKARGEETAVSGGRVGSGRVAAHD